MAGQAGSKIKILYLKQYFEENTDAEHGATIEELAAFLEQKGLSAERKALYADIAQLREFGMDIMKVRGKRVEYRLMGREFELPELKLLVDAVGASRFITRRKSLSLMAKLESLCSRFEAKQLHRSVYVDSRIKTMNESIFYTVDTIYTALGRRCKLSFKYFTYTPDKQRVLKRSGKVYQVTPLALTYREENYYLYAYTAEHDEVRTYRVDRMTSAACMAEPADATEKTRQFDPAAYAREQFNMFAGRKKQVTMRFVNELCPAVIDRFGREVTLVPDGDGFRVAAEVMVSPTFFSWIISFAGRAAIVGPQDVRDEFYQLLRRVERSSGLGESARPQGEGTR